MGMSNQKEIYILGINGSPRNYGGTYKLLKIALKAAENEGAKVRMYNLYEMDIKPCIGCLCDIQEACRYPCVIDDDMNRLYKDILAADGLIIATPIFWYSPSGPTKNFIDRLTVFENMIFITGRSWVEGKVCGLIAVGNDSGSIMVLSNLMITLNSMGFIIPPFAIAYYTEMGDVLEKDSTVYDAYNVGRNVVLMARIVREFKSVWYVHKEVEKTIIKLKKLINEEARENASKVRSERYKVITKLLRNYNANRDTSI